MLTLQQTTFIVSIFECEIFCYLKQEICMLKVWIKIKEWSKYNCGVLVLLNHLSEIKARPVNIVGYQHSCRVCQTGQFLT